MPENQPKYCTTNRRATENASIWQHPSYSWSAIMVGWHIPCGLAHSQGESPIQHHHLLLGMFTNSMETHNQIMWQDVVETYDQGANILSATRSDTPPPTILWYVELRWEHVSATSLNQALLTRCKMTFVSKGLWCLGGVFLCHFLLE